MCLSQFQKERCLQVMDQLSSFTISKMFAQPVDPERDRVPNYFQIVKNPMDLGTVRKKLVSDQYPTVAKWKEDVELIWSNSFLVNNKSSILGYITLEMQSQFRKLSQYITDNIKTDWMNKLYALRDDLANLSLKSGKQTSHYLTKKDKSKSPRPSKQPVQPKPKIKKTFTKAEICQLTSDINSLRNDEVHVQAIIDILYRYEKNFRIKGEVLELDLETLQTTTLSALREKVDQIMGLT
ncbi:Bromodomain containing protein [Histomonas meleagridis]|uniref:Bromodomain containing protein n=1 Tax=Histomonas meleagridis TaxID=135588 RepID=UPI003559B454|nr:Bromodomain containing protein [Histomonas meleagridis]KAH0800846.1 Bromodomain containing protein [Histomonas meleagridis]